MDAVHAVITVSAHPAVGRATQHKFKAGSDTWCSHRQHLSKAGGMDFLMLLNKPMLQKQDKATNIVTMLRCHCWKSRGTIQNETRIFTDYEQLQGEVTSSIQVKEVHIPSLCSSFSCILCDRLCMTVAVRTAELSVKHEKGIASYWSGKTCISPQQWDNRQNKACDFFQLWLKLHLHCFCIRQSVSSYVYPSLRLKKLLHSLRR